MATKLMLVVLVSVSVFVFVVPVSAGGGVDDDLVSTMLAVRETGTKLGKAMDKFYVRFCSKGFLAFTQDGTQPASYCQVGVARAFVGGQLNRAGTSYTTPKGWTADEFGAFVRWTAQQ
jgi:hypothetical protein